MTKDEALDLALKALESIPEEVEGYLPESCTDAVIAIKQALAAPVQEPVKFLANGTRFKTSESPYGVCINSLPKELSGRWVALVAAEDDCHLQLTTPPAAQRTWVGLTETEVDECYESVMFNPDTEPTRVLVYQAIEAKLRSKNT